MIAPPKGWCIDPKGSRDAATGALVILRGCAGEGLFGARAGRGLLMVSVAAKAASFQIEGTEAEVAIFFESEPGHAALSRSGQANTVQVLETLAEPGIVLIRAEDSSPFPGGGAAPDYWRALFGVGGHLVTLSVLSAANQPMSRSQGLDLLREFAAQVRSASGDVAG